jgi:DNA ligase (NAD+)
LPPEVFVAISEAMTDVPDGFDPAERAAELRHRIEQADYEYYILDNPTLADGEYDALMRELRSIEERYPETRDESSQTVQVSGGVGSGFAERQHPRPMLSLGNVFSHEGLEAWFKRVRNLLPTTTIDFVVEPKIDGLAIALTYERGAFRIGATRGNGIKGEDVTANLRTVSDVPRRLGAEPIPERVEVRGEIYMKIEGFEQLNQRRAAEGQPLFANPRNSAAGSLRQLDASITASRPLCLWAYQIGYAEGFEVESQWQALEQLRAWGFPVNPLVRHISSLEEVHAYCDEIGSLRDTLPYDIDGVVIKINDVALQQELGAVGREPRWAMAYKFPPRQATTRLLDIQVNVGRTGAINPFAVLDPVTIGGVTVRLATLHNEGDIRRKDIRIGDRVIVQRAGDVIPQVVKPIVEDRDGSEVVYSLPDACPSCGTPIVRPENEAMAYCPNPQCPAQRFRWIEHFVSEGALDIRGLGERMAQVLLDHGLIRDPADIYSLTEEQLLQLPGIKEKSASNILASIEASKSRPLDRIVFGLGIRYVGSQVAEKLVEAFPDLDRIAEASVEELETANGVGHKTAESVVEWMSGEENRDILARLKAAGLTWTAAPAEPADGPLAGSTFLITGKLEGLSRGQAESRLTALGGAIAPGMNKSVDYLIVGADPGSKLARAQKLGTPVKDEQWLLRVLDDGAIPPEETEGPPEE